jgi:hydroxymethylglutaryl-CoA reductase (NADPH)
MKIPSFLLKKLYTVGSLRNTDRGAQFALKNRLSDAELTGLKTLMIDGEAVALADVRLDFGDHHILTAQDVGRERPLPFPLRSTVTIWTGTHELRKGSHEIEIGFEARPFGNLQFKIKDAIADPVAPEDHIPRDDADDYRPEIIERRRSVIERLSGVELKHIVHPTFDPHITKGNCENFVGVAQVPLGIAGPVKVDGEYAKGEFLVPLATSEGTLVASYNRGIKVLNMCGGARTTVVADAMQRAPVFVFRDARAGRDFLNWVQTALPDIRREAEATSSVARLKHIDPYVSNNFVYLRFNFLTGDAAGQNMVGRATYAACNWILEHYPGVQNFYLESNLATDKKSSQVNIMHTRGKRVTAEATIRRDVLVEQLWVEPRQLVHHYGVANVGAILSGANNNGAHSANGITAMFIATGQDVANVSESSAGILYLNLTADGDLYISLTIPSLIVATYGGGTSLATQRECLEILGCYGKGKVNKLAEIVAAVALAGEISLGAAISSGDWVSSHENLGRNR